MRRRAGKHRRAYHRAAAAYYISPAAHALMRARLALVRLKVAVLAHRNIGLNGYAHVLDEYSPARVASRAEQHSELVAGERQRYVRLKRRSHLFARVGVKPRRNIHGELKRVLLRVQPVDKRRDIARHGTVESYSENSVYYNRRVAVVFACVAHGHSRAFCVFQRRRVGFGALAHGIDRNLFAETLQSRRREYTVAAVAARAAKHCGFRADLARALDYTVGDSERGVKPQKGLVHAAVDYPSFGFAYLLRRKHVPHYALPRLDYFHHRDGISAVVRYRKVDFAILRQARSHTAHSKRGRAVTVVNDLEIRRRNAARKSAAERLCRSLLGAKYTRIARFAARFTLAIRALRGCKNATDKRVAFNGFFYSRNLRDIHANHMPAP